MVEKASHRRLSPSEAEIWSQRFKKHRDFPVSVASRMGIGSESEDRAQDAWLRLLDNALRSPNPVDFDQSPRGLLATVTTNLVYDDARRKRRRPLDLIKDAEILELFARRDEEPEGEFSFENSPLFRALGQLEDRLKIPLVLRTLFDCSYDQIAETLNIPVGTVRSRLHRAKKEMKKLLPPEEEVRDMTA